MPTSKTSQANARVGMDKSEFVEGAKAVMDAAESMSKTVTAAFKTMGVAILAVFGAKTVSALVDTLHGVLEFGEAMANAGKRAGTAAGQFYLFNAAVEKGLSLKTVAKLVGENAEALNRSANLFRDVSIKLWAVGEKIRGFWLGLMERVAPMLARILDGALGAQLVSAGNWFGEAITNAVGVIYELAQDGTLWDTLRLGLKIAFDYAGERLLWMGKLAYEVVKEFFSAGFVEGITSAIATIWGTIKDFAKSVGDQVGSAFLLIWATINGMANSLLNKVDKALNAMGALSDEELESRTAGRNIDTAKGFSKAAMSENQNPKVGPVSDFLEKIKNLFNSKGSKFEVSDELGKSIADFQNVIAKAMTGYKAREAASPLESYENNTRQAAFGADSLTAMGGGGGVYLGLSVLDVNKMQLRELQEINRKMGAKSGDTQNVINQYSPMKEISRMQTSSPVN